MQSKLMTPFLKKLALKVIEEHSNVSNTWIVLPSHRACIYFKKYLKENITQTSWAPKTLTIDQFIKQHAPLTSISNIQLLLKLYEIHQDIEKEKAETLDSFMGWGPMLLGDFNEIDHYLLNYKTVFQDLRNIKEIDNWSFNQEELTDIQHKTSDFWKKIPIYYDLLNQKLDEEKKGYNGKIYKWVANSIFEVVNYFEDNSVYFAGFNALSNSERQIIQTFVSSGKGNFIIDGDQFYINKPAHEAGYFIRKNAKTDFLNSDTWIENDLKETSKQINLIATTSNITQTRYCGNILENMSQEEINQTAIVLGDETLLSPLLNSLPSKIERYNISLGYNLFNSPLGNLIQTIFNVQQNFQKYNGSIHYRTFFSLINHYFLDLKKSTQNIKNDIINKNILFISKKYLSNQNELNQVDFLLKPWDANNLIFNAQEVFYKLIDVLKIRFDINQHALELEYLYEFEKLLKKLFNEFGDKNYVRSLSTIKNIIYQLLKSEDVSFIGEPLDGLQIIGTLETRSLDFKNIIMLSVNDDRMPKSSTSNSFIPFELKRLYGLPTFKEKEAIYAHHFYRLIQRTENLTLIYNELVEGVSGSEKSRYINQLKNELPTYNPNIIFSEKTIQSKIEINTEREVSIKSSPELVNKILELNVKGFSPTALRTFINCELDFYFKYVAGMRDEEEVNETIEANTLGSIIHTVLEELYKPHLNIDKPLKADDIDKMIESFEKILQEEFSKQYSKDYKTGKNYLLFHASYTTIHDFLKKEKEVVENHSLKILALEKEYTKEVTLKINGKEESIKLRGTIDRIDSLDNKIRLIDYKTGKVDNGGLKADNLEAVFSNPKLEKAFQLLLYYFLVEEEYPNLEIEPGIISFKSISSGVLQLNTGKTDIKSLMEDYKTELELLFGKLFDTQQIYVHNEDSTYCQYC